MARKYSSEYKNLQPYVVEDIRKVVTAAGAGGGSTGVSGVTDHGALTGLADDDHPQYLTPVRGDARYITATRQVIAGNGLTGGGMLTADVTLNVAVANTGAAGLTVEADAVRLTSSSSPGAAASILATTAAGLLTLQNGAFVQAAQSNATFASGFAGSGWRVDYGVTTASKATAEFDDLTVRGRMRIYELLIQQIRATNGSLLVTSSSKVVSVTTSTNPAWTVNGVLLYFNGTPAELKTTLYSIATATSAENAASKRTFHGFLVGDVIRAQQVEWNGSSFAGVIQSNLEVTTVTSLYEYTAAKVSGDAAAVGYDYVRLGSTSDSTRRGVVYLTSDDSAAPFIDVVDGVQYHADWNSANVARVRVGKLTGISDAAFGGALSGYGLYGNNVYLKGKIVVTGGDLGGLAAADVNSNTTTIDGGRITANSVTASQIAASTITATQIAAGTITGDQLSLSSYIAIKSSTWQAQGMQFQYNGGTPRFYVGTGGVAPGTPTAKYITFDGSEVEVRGTVDLTGGVISGPMSTTGSIYAGNAAVRLSTDGVRMVLPNLGAPNLKTTIPSNSSAMRWMASITDAWTNAANYTGMIGYRDTTNKVVDFVQMSYVGSTDYSTYYARSMLYANRYNGSTDKECRLEVTVDPGAGDAYVTATCATMYATGNVYVTSNCSALSFTDRTPHYEGDALAELRQIRGKAKTVKGKQVKEIDHSTLPAFARVALERGANKQPEEGRDLGAMISMLTVAVQQLDTRLDALEGRNNGRQ